MKKYFLLYIINKCTKKTIGFVAECLRRWLIDILVDCCFSGVGFEPHGRMFLIIIRNISISFILSASVLFYSLFILLSSETNSFMIDYLT